ncbi:MAG: HAMP domain-containing sensor histidine kinase [Erysipelotrichaceae bacterium]
MKDTNKVAILFVLFAIACMFYATIDINIYFFILILIICFAILWFSSEFKIEHRSQNENQELMAQVRTTSKDANIKRKQLLTMVTALPWPMLMLDQFGKIVLYNTHLSIFGPLNNIEDMNYLNNKFHPKVQEYLKDAFILEKEIDKVIKIDDCEFQVLSVPILSKNRFSGCLLLFQDVSKTLAGEKMQKRFIADASHELKTPIAVIKGMMEILNREDFHDEEVQKDFMKQIIIEVDRLDIIVKDMLQLSRLSIDNPILERKNCNLVELIDSSINPLSSMIAKSNLKLVKDYQYLGDIFIDPQKIGQVIVNLVSNAIKYSEHGTITIQVKQQSDHEVVLSVSDQGHGFNETDKKRIFERFYRIDDDRSRKSGGSGLGLAIVKSIVDAHGAKIVVDSKINEGTTFKIILKN